MTAPLRQNRDFLLFVVGRGTNVTAIHGLTVVVGWDVWQMSRDPVDLGLIGLAQFAPAFALFLAAGLAADRLDRRLIMAACTLVHVVAVLLLLGLVRAGGDQVGAILAVLTLHGAARSFYHTANQALLPNLVPAAQFPNAIAWSSSISKIGQLVGPAAAGVGLSTIGHAVYWPIVALLVVAGVTSILIRKSAGERPRERATFETVIAGFAYVWREKVVLGAISIDLLAVLFGTVVGILPIYADEILNVGPDGLGLMRAMPGLGSLFVGLILVNLAAPRHMGAMMFWALAMFGASVIVFGLSDIFWLSLIALAVHGGADMVSVYVRQSLVQLATPDGMRGRVSAVNSIAINASNEIGDFRAGMSAAAFGVVPAVLAGGVATLGVTALWAVIFPGIRKIDRLGDVKPSS